MSRLLLATSGPATIRLLLTISGPVIIVVPPATIRLLLTTSGPVTSRLLLTISGPVIVVVPPETVRLLLTTSGPVMVSPSLCTAPVSVKPAPETLVSPAPSPENLPKKPALLVTGPVIVPPLNGRRALTAFQSSPVAVE